MKGQTQAVTAVLVTGLVVGGIGTAYMWGVPMLEKRQVEQEVTSTEDKVRDLYDSIVSVSDQGSGATSEVTLEADNIRVNEQQEYIQITNELNEPAEQGFSWSLLQGAGSRFVNTSIFEETGNYGIKGEEKPGIIAFKSTGGQSSSQITYRIDFRNLCSKNTDELSKIDLQVSGQERAAGSATIQVSNEGENVNDRVIMERGHCQGTTSRTSTLVQLSFE